MRVRRLAEWELQTKRSAVLATRGAVASFSGMYSPSTLANADYFEPPVDLPILTSMRVRPRSTKGDDLSTLKGMLRLLALLFMYNRRRQRHDVSGPWGGRSWTMGRWFGAAKCAPVVVTAAIAAAALGHDAARAQDVRLAVASAPAQQPQLIAIVGAPNPRCSYYTGWKADG